MTNFTPYDGSLEAMNLGGSRRLGGVPFNDPVNLRETYAIAVEDQTIYLEVGTYQALDDPDCSNNVAGNHPATLCLTLAVTIENMDADTSTRVILDGSGSFRVLTIWTGDTYVTKFIGMEVTGGEPSDGDYEGLDMDGGGAYIYVSDVSFSRCDFRLNKASSGDGGGLFIEASQVTFYQCEFTGNEAVVSICRRQCADG